jgi:putative membrane protein
MLQSIPLFVLDWATTAVSLWAASHVFKGIQFTSVSALIISALLLGFVNAWARPLVIVLTLPLTLITLGFFLLVINALMIKLVAAFVIGFKVSGFWTAFFASIFISLLSMALGVVIGDNSTPIITPGPSTWV